MWNHKFHTLIAVYHHLHQASTFLCRLSATYLFLRGALLRGYLGCLRRRRVLGRRKVGEVLIFFLLWLCTPLSTAFLAFRAFDLASVLAGTTKRDSYVNDRPKIGIALKNQRRGSVKLPAVARIRPFNLA